MQKTKRSRLEAAGWRIGSAKEFLGLTPEEAALVELKLTLSTALRIRRTARHVSQNELAKRLGSSQSRVAKMEAADPSVSIEMLLKGLFALGASRRDLAKAIQRRNPTVAA